MTSSSNTFKQIGDAVTGILKGFSGEKATEETNQTKIELANTAHQREVADLKAAGLNPTLSVTGSGAETPVLDTPSNKAAAALDIMQKMTELSATKKNMDLQSNQIKQINSDINNNTNITNAEVGLKEAQKNLTTTQNNIESWKGTLGDKGNKLLNNIIDNFGKNKGDALSFTKNNENIKNMFKDLTGDQQEAVLKQVSEKLPALSKTKFGKTLAWLFNNRNKGGN